MNNQIQNLIKVLGCTKEEAQEIIKADSQIDKGEKLFELTPEQEKASKKARMTGTKKPTVYNFDTKNKKKKENPEKQYLIEFLKEALVTKCENINVTNVEREITFEYAGTNYRLTLAVPRTKKDKNPAE